MPALSCRSHLRAAIAIAALLGASALVGVGVAPAAAADVHVTTVPASRTITFAGHAWGHGHGLSQEGASGAAGVAGLSARQITAFYYPHTRAADIGNPTMRVALSAVA